MPAISELPVPETRSLAAVPVPETGLTQATPEQRDAEAFQATAGEVRKGLRSSINSLGASLQSAAGGSAEALGLTDFANERFKEAADFAAFSDAVAPVVRDYRAVKDTNDALMFVAGAAGTAVGSTAPAIVGGLVGGRVGGLRGAALGAGMGSFVPETGEALQTYRGEPGSPQKKLAVAAGKGAVNAALDVASLAVPAGAVAKGLRAAAPKAISTIGKSIAAEGTTEGIQEVVGQQAHSIINPARDTSEDVPQAINAGLQGAVGGAVFGAGGAAASKLAAPAAKAAEKAFPTDRPQTVEEAKAALDVRERPGPLDPDPLTLPDDPDEMGAELDKHDAKLDAQMARDWSKVKDREEFKQYDGWEKDLAKREGLHEALGKRHADEVDKPFARRALEGLKKYVDKIRPPANPGEKSSLRRTALDVFVLDEFNNALPEHLKEAFTPQEKLEYAEALKQYAMHTAGRQDELPGPGAPETRSTFVPGKVDFDKEGNTVKVGETKRGEPGLIEGQREKIRAIPHGIMDILGDKTWGVINKIQQNLGKTVEGKLGKPITKKEVQRAERRRGERLTRDEDFVLAHLRAEHLVDPETRTLVVREMTRDLHRRVGEGLNAQNEAQFKAKMNYAFGENAEAVFDHFDKQREDITRGYEDLGEIVDPRTDESVAQRLARNEQFRVTEEDEAGGAHPVTEPEPNPTGEQATPEEENHPYRDKRLGVPLEMGTQLDETLRALRDEYDPQLVRFKAIPELDKDGKALTGRFTLHAEDAEAPVGFDKHSLERIQEKHGKAGLENSVVTIVRKDPDNPERNKTIAVSIPNLVAETMRTTRRIGKGAAYVHDMVMEGLSRLASDPDFVRFAPSSDKAGWNFPDDMFVATVNDEDFTWKDVRESESMSSEELHLSSLTTDLVEQARHADKLLEVTEGEQLKGAHDDDYEPLPAGEALVAMMERNLKRAEGDKYMTRRIADAIAEVENEIHRREKEGDSPFFDMNRDQGTTISQAEQAKTGREFKREDVGGARNFDELGLPTLGAPRAGPRGPTPGQKAGPVTVIKGAKAPVEEKKLVPSVAFERAFRTWQEKDENKGKDLAAYMKELGEYTGGSRKTKALQAEAVRLHNATKGVEFGKMPPKGKLSEMRVGAERMAPEEEQRVEAEVKRLLGNEGVAVKFLEQMRGAGSFANLNGVETIAISVRALDALGEGRHEAFHAMFERLMATNPEAARVLSNAARSPTVMAQLRSLLKSEPEALKQLADHEERAAFMYSFWAADKLHVGPETRTIFEKARAMLGKAIHAIFGVGNDPTTAAKAEELLRAFHDGSLADRSAAGEVISKILPKDEIAGTWVGRLADWSNRVWSTADGYIRDQGIPAFTDKADLFYNPGDGKPGMLQTKIPTFHRFMNRYATAVANLEDTAERRILESLQQQKDLTRNAAEASAVRAVRSMLDDVWTYMDEKGVKEVVWSPEAGLYVEKDLGKALNYFPRVFDKGYVETHRDEFIELLKKHGFNEKKAGVFADKLTTTGPVDPKGTPDVTFYEPHTMSRKLDISDAELAPFMKKDLGSIMYDYLNYAVRRAEYADRFGNQGQGIAEAIELAKKQGATESQVKSFEKYVHAVDGTVGNEMDPKLRRFMGAVLTYQNFRLLPLALFSSLVDPTGIVVRGGTAKDGLGAFARGIHDLFSTKEDEARQFARLVGAITTSSDEHMVADMYGQNYGSAWQKWLNQKLFRLNGMESWNNSMRTAAAAAARDFIIKHATEETKHSARWLRELGLEKGDVHVDNGQLDLTPQVVDAVNKWVDGAVLRPHAAIRPIWGSDPNFMLVMHLKQFSYAFQKTINDRVVNEALQGNLRPLAVVGSYVPFIIAADMLRALVTPGGGDDNRWKQWELSDWLAHGVSRAGITGPGQYALDSAMDLRHGLPSAIAQIGGPTAQQISDLGRAAFGSPGTDLRTEALRALPFVPAVFPGRIGSGS